MGANLWGGTKQYSLRARASAFEADYQRLLANEAA
jgi:hypothetical protein